MLGLGNAEALEILHFLIHKINLCTNLGLEKNQNELFHSNNFN